MKLLRLTLLMYAVAAMVCVPAQANWLAKINASVAPVQKSLLSKTRTILRKCTPKKIAVSPDSFIGRRIQRKHSVDYVRAFEGLDSKWISREEFQNFTCPKKPSSCEKVEDYHKGALHVNSYNIDGISRREIGLSEITSIACKKCKLWLKYSDDHERTIEISGSYVDAEGKTMDDQEQPKQKQIATPVAQEQSEKSEIKALPVTSVPEKGFYARVKAMFKKR